MDEEKKSCISFCDRVVTQGNLHKERGNLIAQISVNLVDGKWAVKNDKDFIDI